jgi:hypothetical protein
MVLLDLALDDVCGLFDLYLALFSAASEVGFVGGDDPEPTRKGSSTLAVTSPRVRDETLSSNTDYMPDGGDIPQSDRMYKRQV